MESKPKRNSKGIVSWPEDDRPREKLLKKGEHSLSDAELLAILLRSGVKGQSALDLARQILQKFKTLRNMRHTDIRDWKGIKGLGKAKIAQLKAALEIARRFNSRGENLQKQKIRYTEEIVELFQSEMRSLKNEVVKVVLCDSRNGIIETVEIVQGTPTESYPIVREIMSKALQKFASGIICIHNHPFGDPTPSKDDRIFTSVLKEAGNFIGIRLLDHIIFGEEEYYSFDKGITKSY
jgi:DNA repair protein RadC